MALFFVFYSDCVRTKAEYVIKARNTVRTPRIRYGLSGCGAAVSELVIVRFFFYIAATR